MGMRGLFIIGGQGLRWRTRVIQLNEGQPGHTLKTQRGKSSGGHGCRAVHGKAHQHVAGFLAVQRNRLYAPHSHALVAHRGLFLQASYAFVAGDFEQAVLTRVAREPGSQPHQHGDHHQHKSASSQGV